MEYERKTREELIEELMESRKRNDKLEAAIKELRQPEEKLRESEERLRSLFEGIPIGLYQSTPEGKVIDGNPALWKMLGYPNLKAMMEDNVADNYVNPEDRRKWRAQMERDGVVPGFEVQWRRKDGRVIWVRESARIIRDKNGKVKYYEGSAEDITEKKKAEQEKRESEEKFRALLESAAEGILVADLKSRKFLYANPAICKMLGYTEMELKGIGVADIHPKDSLKHVISEFEAQARAEKILAENIPCLRKDGTVIYADIKGTKVLIGGEECNLGFFTDVTEQRRMDEELRSSEERLKQSEYRYRILVENLPQKIFLKNKDSVYISCNENYARDLKIKPDKIAGKTDYDFYPKELADKYRADDKRIMALGKIEDIEEKYIQDGREAWVHTVKTPVKDENGNIVSILGIFWDITEQRQAAEKLKVSLEEKEVLLKEIHHRVKNNMQIISSLLRLQTANIKDEKILEVFNEVHGRIRSMSLLYEMLYQSKDLARVDFAEYIKRLTSHLISMHRAKMTAPSLRLGVSDVHLDIKRAIPCGLIITELISNSLKHAFPNGKKGEIVVEMHPNKGEKYKLVVSDNGVGFPEGLDFRLTKSLGMRLVVDLVKQLDGTIELRREKGTEFRIEF